MNSKTLQLNTSSLLYKGFFEFSELQYCHSLYRGGVSPTIKREVFNRNQAVVVLLYDLEKQCVVLVEQCRAGAVRNALAAGEPDQAWLLEPVAGMIDKGETPLQAGIRETWEETGLRIEQLEAVCQFYPSPGGCDEILHLYAAEIDSQQVLSHAGNQDEHEDIKVVVMPFLEAQQKLHNAEFNVSSTIIALQWLFNQKT